MQLGKFGLYLYRFYSHVSHASNFFLSAALLSKGDQGPYRDFDHPLLQVSVDISFLWFSLSSDNFGMTFYVFSDEAFQVAVTFFLLDIFTVDVHIDLTIPHIYFHDCGLFTLIFILCLHDTQLINSSL